MNIKYTNSERLLFFLISDILIITFTSYISYLLRFDMSMPPYMLESCILFIIFNLAIKINLYFVFKIYFIQWRFFSLRDFAKIILINFSSSLVLLYIGYSFIDTFPRSVVFIEFFLSVFFLASIRGSKRIFYELVFRTGDETLIVGAGKDGEMMLRFLQKEKRYNPVAFLDLKSTRVGTFIQGVKVKTAKEILKEHKSIKNAIISSPNQSREELDNIYKFLKELSVESIKIASKLKNRDETEALSNLSIEDLLARKPKDLDKETIKSFIDGKKILITGAGGSIGSEIARQCVKYGAKELILLDHSEFNLYSIYEELESESVFAVMHSILDLESFEKTFTKYRPDVVIHAAAYKHVPLVEFNIDEALKNNIVGTKNSIDLAIKYRVKKFILISTDKAVRPTNVMGTTKRICELYAQNSNHSETEIVAVRFGNVLGSSGSVIPKFKKQIELGEPITVTHPDITRYFMLIPEACELVLQAGSLGKGGEIFILDMGEPVKIVDLAKRMLELYNREDIEIKFIGLRRGEKLYEELLIDESEEHTKYESITVGKRTIYDIDTLTKDIEELFNSKDKIEALKRIVPEFEHKIN